MDETLSDRNNSLLKKSEWWEKPADCLSSPHPQYSGLIVGEQYEGWGVAWPSLPTHWNSYSPHFVGTRVSGKKRKKSISMVSASGAPDTNPISLSIGKFPRCPFRKEYLFNFGVGHAYIDVYAGLNRQAITTRNSGQLSIPFDSKDSYPNWRSKTWHDD